VCGCVSRFIRSLHIVVTTIHLCTLNLITGLNITVLELEKMHPREISLIHFLDVFFAKRANLHKELQIFKFDQRNWSFRTHPSPKYMYRERVCGDYMVPVSQINPDKIQSTLSSKIAYRLML